MVKNILNTIKQKKWILVLSAASVIVLALIIWLAASVLSGNFYKGIYVDELNLSGLKPTEAKAVLDYKNNNLYLSNIVLKSEGKEWSIKCSDISLRYLTDEALQEAYSVGRTGNIFQRAWTVLSLKFNDIHINTDVSFDRDYIINELMKIKSQIDRGAKNSEIIFEDGEIGVKDDVEGRTLNLDSNLRLIENRIISRNYSPIELKVEKISPEITYGMIKNIDAVLSEFSTYFNPGEENRVENLKLSCSRINGKILLPGDVFSMNKVLGPRTYENGYKDAKVILNNEYVDGVGGGICQLTSTLYNAVLISKLKIIERQHHSIASVYISPGQDATIADKLIDFKFKNNKDYPISIGAAISGGTIKIDILGRHSETDYTVKLVPDIIKVYQPIGEEYEIDNSVPDFEKIIVQKPKNGYRVILYRETFDENGNMIKKEKISDDTYKPAKAIVKVNENYLKNSIDLSD